MITDKQLAELALAEGRAYVATIHAAERRDFSAAAKATLLAWHDRQAELRAAVLTRLEAERAASN